MLIRPVTGSADYSMGSLQAGTQKISKAISDSGKKQQDGQRSLGKPKKDNENPDQDLEVVSLEEQVEKDSHVDFLT